MGEDPKRKEEAELIADLKRLVAENPAVAAKLKSYLNLCLQKLTERYDSTTDYAETCRIQGGRQAIKSINRVVLGTT